MSRSYPLFSLSSLIVRFSFAFLVVFGIYNPSGVSYVHWLLAGRAVDLPVRMLIALGLAAIIRVIVVISWRSLGLFGMASFFIITIATVLSLGELIDVDAWVVQATLLSMIALYFGLGMCWSGILYRISRQVQSTSIAQNQSIL